MNTISVVYILDVFPAPTERFILNEIKALEERGVNLTILVLKRQRYYEKQFAAQYSLQSEVHYLPRLFFLIPIPIIFHFRRCVTMAYAMINYSDKAIPFLDLLRNLRRIGIARYFCDKLEKVGHLHAHFAFISTDIAAYMSELLQVPYSFTAHAKDIYTRNQYLKTHIRKAKFVITCTRYNGNYLNLLTDNKFKNKIFSIYHGIQTEKLSVPAMLPKQQGIHHILTIGRFVEKKGILYLLKAIHILHERNIPLRCIIIGEGPMRKELLRYISEYNLNNQVSILPFMPHHTLIKYYQQADVFVLPCMLASNGDRDGIPNVILEAMHYRVPVITTGVSALPELVENNRTGVVVEEHDPVSIADAIVSLKNNRTFQERIVVEAKDKVHKYFNIDNCIDQLLHVFKTKIATK